MQEQNVGLPFSLSKFWLLESFCFSFQGLAFGFVCFFRGKEDVVGFVVLFVSW